jgi:catechol 2,3-dioxygenase-like lactoylglutathione lyase family enzyme
MIDHMGFRVRDLAASRHFYEACAGALGLQVIDNTADSFLIGRSQNEPLPFIWVGTTQPAFWTTGHTTAASPLHLGFTPAVPPRWMRSTARPWRQAASTMVPLVRAVRRR